MKNPKTTVAGYLALAASMLALAAKLLNGEMPSVDELAVLAAALGLVAARDGGH